MKNRFALTKDDHETIGFVIACLAHSAIDIQDLQSWADHVLTSAESYPLYIVDLSTYEGHWTEIYEVIGFTPSARLTRSEEDALTGISLVRGHEQFEPVDHHRVLTALRTQPQLIARFRDTFPFIELRIDGYT
jgi:hypothetical protein